MTAEPRRIPPWIMAAGLALLTFAVFAPSLRNGYVDFDDPTDPALSGHVSLQESAQNGLGHVAAAQKCNSFVSHVSFAPVAGTSRAPKIPVPTRTKVAPSPMATAMSCVMPIDSSARSRPV